MNSRNPNSWNWIKKSLDSYFRDSLIQYLQRINQLSNDSPSTFVSNLHTHESKMFASIKKQNLIQEQKEAQIKLIELMALNTLVTGFDPKLGQIFQNQRPSTSLPPQQKKNQRSSIICPIPNFYRPSVMEQKQTHHFNNEPDNNWVSYW